MARDLPSGERDGAYRQDSDGQPDLRPAGEAAWSDDTLTLKARKTGGAEGFLIVFGAEGDNKYWWNIGGWGNREHGIEHNRTPVGAHQRGTIQTGRWYDIRIELRGQRIRCLLDGKLIHDVEAPGFDRVFAVAGREEATGDLIVKAVNLLGEPMTTTLKIAGAPKIAPEAQVWVLTSAGLRDDNSFEAPTRVAPRTSTLGVADSACAVELQPHSFTVIRLKTR